MVRMLTILVALGALMVPGVAAESQVTDGRVQRGQVFAQAHCAGCHAVGRSGESPLTDAPPFRTLHERYPVEYLMEALAEGIVTGHPAMPEFRLDVAQINDLIAYLKSLE